MGVPAFFRWLSRKYPSIVVHCDDGVKGQYHFDNLYLDMNGIIHPCSHPENKPPPENEEEMFLAIFEYVEDIMKIVKPKKMLYMAVDGVAPRAKMNQQRSRRFRAAQESYDKMIEVQKVKDELRARGVEVKEKEKSAHFDSNVITPGTQFMLNLSDALRTWINRKLSADYKDVHEIWPKDLVIILSDASVPGEGEHKIMDYIRRQKASENYDPNLSHLLYGADADLIMLGLATHEPNFTILREEFKPNQPRPCPLCDQLGHELKDCTGEVKPLEELVLPTPTEFIYIRLNVLREYLERECQKIMVNGSSLDFERFIDDYVFLCFFVGNDFLPHLPSLEIRENAIDRLIKIYKYVLENFKDGGDIYLTKSGIVNKPRCQRVLYELGEYEDEIFKNRQQSELNFKERNKRRKLMQMNQELKWFKPETVSQNEKPQVFHNAKDEASKVRMHYNTAGNSNQRLNSMLVPSNTSNSQSVNPSSGGMKRKLDDSDSEPEDLVQLYNDGWKERYYLHKFGAKTYDKISKMVADEYFKGLCWVLLYYYQGCPDWKWFFPYHYAPFASDFRDIEKVDVNFDGSAKPFHPLEQLMSVFPAASSENLPPTWRNLMTNIESPIIDFYPISFKIDLNGKKAAWMGVALLPFIDEDRLFTALEKVYDDLSEDEKARNRRGAHLIFTSKTHPMLSKKIENTINSNNLEEEPIEDANEVGPSLIKGKIKKSQFFSTVYQNVLCCEFSDPQFEMGFVFPAQLLKNAKLPPPVLKPRDLERFDQYRPVIGMNPRQNQAYLGAPGHRMVERSVHKDYSGEGRGGRYDQRSHHQQHYQYPPRNGPRYDNGNRNYDRRQPQYYQSREQYQPQHQQSAYQSNYSSNSYYQQYSNSSHNYQSQRPPYGQPRQQHSSYHSRSNYPNGPYQQQPRPDNPNIPSYYTRDYVDQPGYPNRQQRY